MSQTVTGRAVLLDMDGTLVNSNAVVERVWHQWALEHELDPAYVLPRIHGRQAHASMAVFLPDRPHEQNLADNQRHLEIELTDLDGVIEVPGAGALLTALDGVPHALVTSATHALAGARMNAAGLPLPRTCVMAEDVTASKPDPEGFLRAASLLGVEPGDCVVVEDSDAGIAAARAAGMSVVKVGTTGTADADLAVTDLIEVQLTVAADGTVTFSRTY